MCSTGICPIGPLFVAYYVYGRNRPNRCSARAQVPPICRRLPNLRRYVKCSSQCHRAAAFALSSRRRRLDECEPTTPERQQLKTQVLWFGSRHNIDRLTIHEVEFLSSTVGVVGSARDLGVVIDSRLSMAHVHARYVRQSVAQHIYHLLQIGPTLAVVFVT